MMNRTKFSVGLVILFVILVLSTSLFTISQGQHGILLRLGRLVIDKQTKEVKIFSPGLHVKLPFIEMARIFDTRLQTIDIKSSRIVTKEKKDVIVDCYVKCRIEDLARYFKATS